MYSKEVLKKSGLVEGGLNDEGEMTYIGTNIQWQKAEILQKEEDYQDKSLETGIKNIKGETLKDKPNFSCPVGSFHSANGCVYPKK